MRKILVVTAFKPILNLNLSVEYYINCFLKLVSLCKFNNIDIVCYTDEITISKIKVKTDFQNFFPYDEKDTFLPYCDKIRSIQNQFDFQNIVQHLNIQSSEKIFTNTEYPAILYSKFSLLRRASQNFTDFSHFTWIDFEIYNNLFCSTNIPLNLYHLVQDNISIFDAGYNSLDQINSPIDTLIKVNPENLLRCSIISVPLHLCEWLENTFKDILDNCFISNNLVCSDECIMSFMYRQYPDKFKIINSNKCDTMFTTLMLNTKLFVINMKKHNDRNLKMKKQLETFNLYNWQIFNGVDGNNLNTTVLKKNNIKLAQENGYYISNRNMTVGEIGCSLSHLSVYNHCIKNNINIACILEDDVIVPPDFDEQLNYIYTYSSHFNWDIIYLGRKIMNFGKKDEEFNLQCPINVFDNKFVISGNSWWTCGYIINTKGMTKIVNSKYLQNLIPIDEALQIMGQKVENSLFNEYCIKEPLKIFALEKSIIHPNNNAFQESSTELSKPINLVDNRLLVIGVATDQTHGLHRFIDSCKYYGIRHDIIGLDTTWKGGNMSQGPGGAHKIHLLYDYIKTIDENQLILVSDTYDVIFTGNSDQIIRSFITYDTDILFATESTCWPDQSKQDMYPNVDTLYKYLNSGGFIGKVDKILLLLHDIHSLQYNYDDQLYYTEKYLNSNKDVKIKLDHQCLIFQTSEFDHLTFGNNKLYNNYTDTYPLHFHGNGAFKKKIIFNNICQYLNNNWTECYGYNSSQNLDSMPSDLKLLVYIEEKNDISVNNDNVYNAIQENIKNIQQNVAIIEYKSNFSSNHNFIDIIRGNIKDIRNQIIQIGKKFDYIWFVSTDVQITSNTVLKDLIIANKSIISPLMKIKDTAFSNFWGDISDSGWYSRSWDYLDIVNRIKQGCWNVPYISNIILIRKDIIEQLDTFFSDIHDQNFNDIDLNFCFNCRYNGIFMHVCNNEHYGDLLDIETLEIKTKYIKSFHDKFNHTKIDEVQLNELIDNVYEFPIFNENFCKTLINKAESYGKWTKVDSNSFDSRIGNIENYPTTDIQLRDLELDIFWKEIVESYISKMVYNIFNFCTKEINLAFIVKYSMDGQTLLEPHHDSSTYTINILLNDPSEFEGGGTHFIKQDKTVFGKQGYAILHPGKLTHFHQGLPITKGVRYLLVSFIN